MLERQRRGLLAAVLASIVQRHRGTPDEFFGQEHIVLLERRRILCADEQRYAQQDAPYADGYEHHGVHAVLADLLRPYRILVNP